MKLVLTAILLSVSFLNAAEIPNIGNFATGLVAYWKLDENSGTPRSQVGGGFGESFAAGAFLTSAGKSGGAVSCLGGTSEFDTTGPNPNVAATEFTTAYWLFIRVIPSSQGQVVFAKENGAWSTPLEIDGRVSFGPAIAGNRYIISTMALNSGQWYHIVTSYSGNNRRQRVYVNASLSKGAEGVNTGNLSSSAGFYFCGFSGTLDGKLDEIAMWKRELTTGEVQQLYQLYSNTKFLNASEEQ